MNDHSLDFKFFKLLKDIRAKYIFAALLFRLIYNSFKTYPPYILASFREIGLVLVPIAHSNPCYIASFIPF